MDHRALVSSSKSNKHTIGIVISELTYFGKQGKNVLNLSVVLSRRASYEC